MARVVPACGARLVPQQARDARRGRPQQARPPLLLHDLADAFEPRRVRLRDEEAPSRVAEAIAVDQLRRVEAERARTIGERARAAPLLVGARQERGEVGVLVGVHGQPARQVVDDVREHDARPAMADAGLAVERPCGQGLGHLRELHCAGRRHDAHLPCVRVVLPDRKGGSLRALTASPRRESPSRAGPARRRRAPSARGTPDRGLRALEP